MRAKAISCLASFTGCAVSADEGVLVVLGTAEGLLLPRFDFEERAEDSKSGVRNAVLELVTVLGASFGKVMRGTTRDSMLVRLRWWPTGAARILFRLSTGWRCSL